MNIGFNFQLGVRFDISEIFTTQRARNSEISSRAFENCENGKRITARNPEIVIGAIMGETKILKRILKTEISPDKNMMYGVHRTVAEIETATTSAKADGIKRCNLSVIPGARKINPPVAKTDKTNPGSCD
jgi:hypothetical protein